MTSDHQVELTTEETMLIRQAAERLRHESELPQPWTEEIARAADVIVSMGCGDVCPIYPGTRYEDWDVPDPSGQPLQVVREIRDDVRTRVEALIASLGLATSATESRS